MCLMYFLGLSDKRSMRGKAGTLLIWALKWKFLIQAEFLKIVFTKKLIQPQIFDGKNVPVAIYSSSFAVSCASNVEKFFRIE